MFGAKSDLIKYRTITNTAGGQINKTSTKEKNEMGVDCSGTPCTSEPIINSFLNVYKQSNPSRMIRKILNIGMDASGLCDFTFTSAPVSLTTTSSAVTFSLSTEGQTNGLKVKILRYLNSCEYLHFYHHIFRPI